MLIIQCFLPNRLHNDIWRWMLMIQCFLPNRLHSNIWRGMLMIQCFSPPIDYTVTSDDECWWYNDFSLIDYTVTSDDEVNHDLEVINRWAYQWKLEFNTDPKKQTTELLFTCMKNSPNHPSLFSMGIFLYIIFLRYRTSHRRLTRSLLLRWDHRTTHTNI